MYEDKLGRRIHVLSRQLKRLLDIRVAKYGVTGVQAGMIRYINKKSKEKNVFARDIEKKFDIRRASIAGMLQNMEKKELIQRELIDSDGRLRRIILTKKALELRRKIDQEIQILEKEALQGITKEEVEKFIQTAEKISANLEEKERIKR